MAAGWRSWEQLKASGISPDGMVFLERSPYGPTRAYFEYERTARGEARVGRKLNGDGCPVLIVCWNDEAESVFQDLGSGMGIPLLTTTIKRLEEHGPLGNFGCWSVYGQPARIGRVGVLHGSCHDARMGALQRGQRQLDCAHLRWTTT